LPLHRFEHHHKTLAGGRVRSAASGGAARSPRWSVSVGSGMLPPSPIGRFATLTNPPRLWPAEPSLHIGYR
jgi:hypothetical protein